LDTTAAYVYNVRSKIKKRGIIFNPAEDTIRQNANRQRDQPQPPPNANPAPEPDTTVPLHPATVTPQLHDDFDYEEAYAYIECVKKTRQLAQPAPSPPPKPNFYEELCLIMEQNLKTSWQMYPYILVTACMLRACRT
jgi:hypothetical protein